MTQLQRAQLKLAAQDNRHRTFSVGEEVGDPFTGARGKIVGVSTVSDPSRYGRQTSWYSVQWESIPEEGRFAFQLVTMAQWHAWMEAA
jgi:hypothetical protein